jgi:type II secretory ATPase GspE/PulE/Tfp pilus assembly ATPase PilB-like protein
VLQANAEALVGKPIGHVLVALGYIRPEDWAEAVSRDPQFPEQALVQQRIITQRALAVARATQWGWPFSELSSEIVDENAAAKLGSGILRRGVLPLASSNGDLRVAISNPSDVVLRDEVHALLGATRIAWVVASPSEIQDRVALISDASETAEAAASEEPEILAATAEAPVVVRLVEEIIRGAVGQGVSDIHIGNWTGQWEVRYRIDGRLAPQRSIEKASIAGVITRLKVLARLDIAQRRLPQDGEIAWPSRAQRQFDIRITTLPTALGEHVALRIFGHTPGDDFSALGFSAEMAAAVDDLCRKSHGLVLVSGPTGSGKTTTLATMLARIQALRPDRMIFTVEDPIEKRITGVEQIPVNRKAGLTFATVLRHLLRADPDVIMVGEVRDLETARIAVDAALTGHLVLATIHANDAPGAVTRLVEIGVDRAALAFPLQGALAQRLVRRVCPRCKQRRPIEREGLIKQIGTDHQYAGDGCPACYGGFIGRVAVIEMLRVGERVRQLIRDNAPEATLMGDAPRMIDDGWEKVRAGITTVGEILEAVHDAHMEEAP